MPVNLFHPNVHAEYVCVRDAVTQLSLQKVSFDMDPISTVESILKLAHHIANAHKKVLDNKGYAYLLNKRCENLAKQVEPLLQSKDFNDRLTVLLEELSDALNECDAFISAFSQKHFIFKLGFGDRDEASFIELSTKLDRISGVRIYLTTCPCLSCYSFVLEFCIRI